MSLHCLKNTNYSRVKYFSIFCITNNARKSQVYIVHFLFSLIVYRTCRTVGPGRIWCPDNPVYMRNCW